MAEEQEAHQKSFDRMIDKKHEDESKSTGQPIDEQVKKAEKESMQKRMEEAKGFEVGEQVVETENTKER